MRCHVPPEEPCEVLMNHVLTYFDPSHLEFNIFQSPTLCYATVEK